MKKYSYAAVCYSFGIYLLVEAERALCIVF